LQKVKIETKLKETVGFKNQMLLLVNQVDATGKTPLHICALKNDIESARILIKEQAHILMREK